MPAINEVSAASTLRPSQIAVRCLQLARNCKVDRSETIGMNYQLLRRMPQTLSSNFVRAVYRIVYRRAYYVHSVLNLLSYAIKMHDRIKRTKAAVCYYLPEIFSV